MKNRQRGRPGPVRRILGLTLLMGMLLVIGGGLWLRSVLWQTRTASAVNIEVARGDSTAAILEQFAGAGLLPSPIAGRLYLEVAAAGRHFHWGTYRFEAGARPIDVLERTLDGRVQTVSVTILEGTSVDDVHRSLLAAGLMASPSWNAFIADPAPISDLAPDAISLEGFLFPDTYHFAVGVDAVSAARHMLVRFRRVWQEERRIAGDSTVGTLDAVILASLIEAETGVGPERARIGGVFTNRLARGMLLQCDPTVVYALKQRGLWTGALLRAHWQFDHPYNTYRYPGLPPGPINNPGRAALGAALAPESHSFLYFVAAPGGGHTFSRTLREHNRAVASLRRSRH